MQPASPALDKRRAREALTLRRMIGIYCRGHHPGRQGLCPQCRTLLAYSLLRLEQCRYAARKPTCAKCPVHCYAKSQRTSIRAVMRYSGWRMLLAHPVLAIAHLLDGVRRVPNRQNINRKSQ